MKNDLNHTFAFYFRVLAPDAPQPEREYEFTDERDFRLDFAWPDIKVGVEIDGAGGGGYGRKIKCHNCYVTVRAMKKDGSFGKELRVPYPSHGSGSHLDRDAIKGNLLVSMGWKLLRVTSSMLENDPAGFIEVLVEVLNNE